MFELVKLISDFLVKSISVPAILEYKKKRRLNEIGTELFLLYLSMNDILVLGRSIVNDLERSIDWLMRHEPDESLYTTLDFKLKQQYMNISRFLHSLRRLAVEMQVISPEAYRSIIPLMYDKGSAVSWLIGSLNGYDSGPQLPYLEKNDYQEIQQVIANGGNIEQVLGEKLKILPVENIRSIKASKYPVIIDYLNQTKPGEQLDEIEKVITMLRGAIEKYFSLQDILLSVGDNRNMIEY